MGTGKTLLCRLLLNCLTEEYITAYIPNPHQTAEGLRLSLARELGMEPKEIWTQYQLLEAINQRLLELHRSEKRY